MQNRAYMRGFLRFRAYSALRDHNIWLTILSLLNLSKGGNYGQA